jgi:phage FluMu protein Com
MHNAEATLNGKCPKCAALPNIIIVSLRARNEVSGATVPVLEFLCDQCRTILAVTLDPEWQAQIVAGQLRTVGERSDTRH